MLKFPDLYGYGVLLGILSLLQLGAVGLIGLNIYSLCAPQNTPKIFRWSIIFLPISAFVYLIEGVVFVALEGSGFTLSFIPFLIIIVLLIFTIRYSRREGNQAPTQQAPATQSSYSNAQSASSSNPQVAINASSVEDGSIYTVNGEAKILKVYDEYVTIETLRNVRSFLTNNFFGGTKKIYYENVIGVQFKPSGNFVLGYIQIELANDHAKDNFNSEGSVTFSNTNVPNEFAREVATFIENKAHEAKKPQVVATTSVSSADELLKYKSLLDQGIITQEEFNAKKKELLGL
ncbi:MAG: SHOCT domain-containing protein [Clostridiales bacterium]|nr:SHOCT domain-containing protein [Clostridiales bacterium]